MNDKRSWAIAAVLIALMAGLFLVYWAQPQQTCGNNTCDPGESMVTCALDCPGTCGDGFCNPDGEDLANCPADCKPPGTPAAPAASAADATPRPSEAASDPVAPPAARAAAAAADPAAAGGVAAPAAGAAADVAPAAAGVRCGDGSCAPGESAATCPADCQPVGRCRDPSFRKIVAEVVKECVTGCSFGAANPVVKVSEAQFRTLFGHGNDTGIGVHFAVFGCNVWKPDGKDCWGYDAHYAEASQCPNDAGYECATRSEGKICNSAGAQAKCRRYAGAIESGVKTFLDRWSDAKYLLLLGTASRTGNTKLPGGEEEMAQKNKELALTRAANVEGLIDRLRGEYEQAKKPINGKSYKVALDNTKQFFDSPGFKTLVGAQMKAGTADPGFKPTTDLAINRSVMLIAVQCDVTAELAAMADKK